MNGTNLMNFFSGAAANPFAAPAPAPQAAAPAPVPQAPADGFNQNPAPIPGSVPQVPAPAANPLDNFTALFNNDPTKQVESPFDSLAKPMVEADFDKLQTELSGAQLVGAVDPALLQRALGGDAASFTQIMNQVAQASFMQAAKFSHNIVESGIKTYNGRLDKALPAHFQNMQTRVALETSNPAFQHEAARPVVDALRQYVVQQMPNATPQQVADKVSSFLSALAPQQAPAALPANGRDPLTGQRLNTPEVKQNWGNWFAGG